MTRPLTETQLAVLAYLQGAERAGTRRIRRETGATPATLMTLASRGLIEPCLSSSYRITEEGRKWR
jgi:hypothetical protein